MTQKTAASKSGANTQKEDDGHLGGSKDAKAAGIKSGAPSQDAQLAKSKKDKPGSGAKATANQRGK